MEDRPTGLRSQAGPRPGATGPPPLMCELTARRMWPNVLCLGGGTETRLRPCHGGKYKGKSAWKERRQPNGPLRMLPLEKFGSRRSSGVGILAVGLSHHINIPSNITVTLKGSLEVPRGMVC